MEKSEEQWFYIHGGDRNGPVILQELKEMYENNRLSEQTMVWTKEFGDNWKCLEEVAEIRNYDEPPLVPLSAISNFWFYLLVAVPIMGAILETIMMEIDPENFSSETGNVGIMIFIGMNVIFGMLDERQIKKSGRKDLAQGIGVWALMIVPVYIFLRGRRTGKGAWPLLGWISALFIGIYAAETLPSQYYFGTGVPSCESKTSISMIEEIYPDIPINFVNASVVNVSVIVETGYNDESKIRSCAAIVRNSASLDTPILYTISEEGDQYYFEVEFNY